MAVQSYELDREVFRLLKDGVDKLKDKNEKSDWQGAASEIADYVATWGVERFWAMSRSTRLIHGKIADPNTPKEKLRYFAWGVARFVLCGIVKDDLGIQDKMTTQEFQEKFRELSFNQQIILVDLLIEIASTIQFWTMRLKDAPDGEV